MDDTNSQMQQTSVERIAAALNSLKPNPKRQKEEMFTQLFPIIRERLKEKVTRAAILEIFEAHGLKLHPARFNELMQVEQAKDEVRHIDTTNNMGVA
jgi:hypothetical protein